MKKIYLCRHGETAWTISGQHTGSTDLSLTEQGQEQASELRKGIDKIHFDAIFSSPRKRAIESCGDLQHGIDPRLAEWDYGDYEGKTTQEIYQVNPSWSIFKDGAPGGESPEQVGKRADAFLKGVQVYSGNVAIFSHGHFLRVLAARYLGLEPQMGKLLLLSVASLSILGEDRGQPAIVLWNQLFPTTL